MDLKKWFWKPSLLLYASLTSNCLNSLLLFESFQNELNQGRCFIRGNYHFTNKSVAIWWYYRWYCDNVPNLLVWDSDEFFSGNTSGKYLKWFTDFNACGNEDAFGLGPSTNVFLKCLLSSKMSKIEASMVPLHFSLTYRKFIFETKRC